MTTSISMTELFAKHTLLQPNELILDVRSPDEFAASHVPGAKNIPHDQVEKHALEFKKYDRVYIHCQLGKRAQMAHETLARAGLKNLVLVKDSGMADWLKSGHPVKIGKF